MCTFSENYSTAVCPQVGILINNAGLFYKHPDFLEAIPDVTTERIVVVNSLIPTMVSKPLMCWCTDPVP